MSIIFIAVLTSCILSILITPITSFFLERYNIKQNVRDDIPLRHRRKSGTLTCGGIIIIISVFITLCLLKYLTKFNLQVFIFILLFGIIGFFDDYLNIRKRSSIKARYRILMQTLVSLGFLIYFINKYKISTTIFIPLMDVHLDLGYFYILFAVLVLIGAVNAVNLTDGLDGLASGVIIISTICFTHFFLHNKNIEGAILSGCIIGSCLGFLWFNAYPAKIFMGNIGSVALGGSLGIFAVLTKTEVLLIIIGGVFVIEALSVIIQVISFKSTGKRVFKMSPIHHHFELSGWSESQIAVRMWILAIIFAMIGLRLK